MPATAVSLPVIGQFKDNHFVLSERLVGYDTFLTGVLEIDGDKRPVRILTLDDVTILKVIENFSKPTALVSSGILHIAHGLRPLRVPEDLSTVAATRRRDLTALDDAELRYALTFLAEATSSDIREARIDAIVGALPPVPRSDKPGRFIIGLDVGGTLGTSSSPSLASRLRNASTLSSDETKKIIREQLYTLPELSNAALMEICRLLGVEQEVEMRAGSFVPDSSALDVVKQLSYYGTVITLSNVSALDLDIDNLRRLFRPWISDFFPSCRTGYVKPDPTAFQSACGRIGGSVDMMIHVGDSWQCDVKGALCAGATPIWISHDRPVPEQVEPGTVLIATELRQVVPLVEQIVGSRA
ncbi:HAD family hydrolase [Nocardia sp. NPDC004068]|uniref:HAD family hydrolase n=1 Tax=Nocardia sp. NPDC004068 TaxID=3364303 RepID=UPI0036AFF8F4